ncbi:hypothetical protein FD754_001009, partial [Muntiacus muntjak]
SLHPCLPGVVLEEETQIHSVFNVLCNAHGLGMAFGHPCFPLGCCPQRSPLLGSAISFCTRIQEAASRGLKFVGVVPQYRCPGSPTADAQDATQEPGGRGAAEELGAADAAAGTDGSPEPGQDPRGETPAAQQPSLLPGEGDGAGSPARGTQEGPDADLPSEGPGELPAAKMEFFALFNKPKSHQKCRQYYPVSIPLRVSKNGPTVSSLDANWLEHMSDHFRKGGVLVNAVSWLGLVHDSLHDLTDGVFIFEAVSTEDSRNTQGYDAIVVEQWTVLDKFQWRFSRDEMRNRPTRKSRGKLRARGKRQAEESEKNPEEQLPRAGDAGSHAPGREDWASPEGAAPGWAEGPVEKPCPDGRPCVEGEAVQNGPAGPSPAPIGEDAEPGEDAGAGVSAEVAPGPVAAERP